MKISNKSGFWNPALIFVSGTALTVLAVYNLYILVPQVIDGTLRPAKLVSSVVLLVIALPAMLQAVTGRQDEWIIGDGQLRIRSRKRRDVLITPAEIDTIDREQDVQGGDSDNGLPYVRFVLTLKDRRVFTSPYVSDDAQINRAWRKLEALMQQGR